MASVSQGCPGSSLGCCEMIMSSCPWLPARFPLSMCAGGHMPVLQLTGSGHCPDGMWQSDSFGLFWYTLPGLCSLLRTEIPCRHEGALPAWLQCRHVQASYGEDLCSKRSLSLSCFTKDQSLPQWYLCHSRWDATVQTAVLC